MPEKSWMADPARRKAAGVPSDLTFATRPAQVIDMIKQARAAGVPFAWFTADEEFGQNPGLCDFLQDNRIPYVMAIPKNTRFTDTKGKTSRIDEAAKRINRNTWQRRTCGIGSKGFRVYDWALLNSDEPDRHYMIRRNIDNGELAFYRCYTPHHASVGELVNVAGARWPIEECFGSAKNEVGLDNYQVRTWNAWHRHITLAMLAHTFLAITAHQAKKGDPRTNRTTTTQPKNQTTRPVDVSSHSPSPKSVDSFPSKTVTPKPSTTACAGQPGADDTKPTPAEPTSSTGSGNRH